MLYYIEYYDNGVVFIGNPVNLLENFAAKWQEHPIRKESFMDWLKQVQLDLTNALELNDVQSVGKSLKPCLGKGVINERLRNLRDGRDRTISTLPIT